MSSQHPLRDPLPPCQIADLAPKRLTTLPETVLAARLRNLSLMDHVVRKCEYRKHIVDYKPFFCHILYGPWRNKPRVDARDEVPYARLDQYAEWGVQVIELHHDVWAHFGRMEPINPGVFTRFVDYCHKKGMEVYVYMVLGQTSLTDPPLDLNALAQPLYPIRPPETRNPDKTQYLATWVQACAASPAWHHYVLSGVEKLFTDYKVDGIYIDGGIVWGERCKHSSHTHLVEHYPRALDKDGQGIAREVVDQGPRLDDYAIDLVNQLCSLAKSYGKGVTAYLNHPDRYSNYGLPNRFIDHRLAGEAGDTKAFRYWIDMNRQEMRAVYQVYAWWDKNTMPPEVPFYACNLPFVQFPFMMQGLFAMDPGWTDEQEQLWVHYARIYKDMAAENTVAYVNVRDSKLFAQPLPNENVICSLFVREDIYVVASNLSDQDVDLAFTAPLEDVETGEHDLHAVRLAKRGGLRILKVLDSSSLEPTLQDNPLLAAMQGVEYGRCDPDQSNLALEAPVTTGTVGKGFFQNAAGYLMETQANDGNLDTYWSPEFDGAPDTWWYIIELREPGPLGKVQVVTRPQDVGAYRLLLSDDNWETFAEPAYLSSEVAQIGGRAFVTYTFAPVPARYLKVAFKRADALTRVYEIRAYQQAAAPIPNEDGYRLLPRIACRIIDEDIANKHNVALGCQVHANYPGELANLVDGDLSTEYVSELIFCGGGPVWCVLDLGRTCELAALQYVPGKGGHYHQYWLCLSEDLSDWVQVVDESENTTVYPSTGRTFAFAPTRARYIALRLNYSSAGRGDVPWHIAQIKAREV